MKVTNIIMNIVIATVIAVIIYFAYELFIKEDAGIDVQTAVSGVSTIDSSIVEEVLDTLNEMQTIVSSLEERIKLFEGSSFRSLVDFHIKINAEQKGRPNPFEPVGEVFANTGSEVGNVTNITTYTLSI